MRDLEQRRTELRLRSRWPRQARRSLWLRRQQFEEVQVQEIQILQVEVQEVEVEEVAEVLLTRSSAGREAERLPPALFSTFPKAFAAITPASERPGF